LLSNNPLKARELEEKYFEQMLHLSNIQAGNQEDTGTLTTYCPA
jgi:hypothetical protein